jgi:hypothetical protein
MEEWVAHADEIIEKDLNHLRVEFIGGRAKDTSPHTKS